MHAGHQDIEENRTGLPRARQGEGRAIVGGRDLIARVVQEATEHLDDIGIIVDDQDQFPGHHWVISVSLPDGAPAMEAPAEHPDAPAHILCGIHDLAGRSIHILESWWILGFWADLVDFVADPWGWDVFPAPFIMPYTRVS
jgi:hypothetical protein